MSTLDRILARMNESEAAVSEKTASAPAATEASVSEDPGSRMLETVRSLSKTAEATKSSSGAALPALDKLAADTAAAEDAVMRKQAELAGAAFMDGAMARLAQYDQMIGSKTASAAPTQAQLEAAYLKGQEDLEKQAAAAFEEGQEAALQEIHKIASDIHVAGQQSARNVLAALERS